jgi:hypothetical protein
MKRQQTAAKNTYTWTNDSRSNLAHVKRVIVSTASVCIRMDECRIFPSLRKASVVEKDVALLELTEGSLLRVLLNGVANLIGGDFVLFSGEMNRFLQRQN